jgi:hypothetical protein
MFENMSIIKATIEKKTLPELNLLRRVSEFTTEVRHSIIPVVSAANISSTWDTGHLIFDFEIFGQYVSRIFYEINRKVRGAF